MFRKLVSSLADFIYLVIKIKNITIEMTKTEFAKRTWLFLSTEHFGLYFDVHLFLQAATVLGYNKSRDLL